METPEKNPASAPESMKDIKKASNFKEALSIALNDHKLTKEEAEELFNRWQKEKLKIVKQTSEDIKNEIIAIQQVLIDMKLLKQKKPDWIIWPKTIKALEKFSSQNEYDSIDDDNSEEEAKQKEEAKKRLAEQRAKEVEKQKQDAATKPTTTPAAKPAAKPADKPTTTSAAEQKKEKKSEKNTKKAEEKEKEIIGNFESQIKTIDASSIKINEYIESKIKEYEKTLEEKSDEEKDESKKIIEELKKIKVSWYKDISDLTWKINVSKEKKWWYNTKFTIDWPWLFDSFNSDTEYPIHTQSLDIGREKNTILQSVEKAYKSQIDGLYWKITWIVTQEAKEQPKTATTSSAPKK